MFNKQLHEGPDPYASLAVEVRQILDLKLGVAFSRFQSKFIKSKYVGFENQVVSYGPCQIPTLSLVVQKQLRINNFVPEPYYRLVFEILLQDPLNKLPDISLNLTDSSSKRYKTKEEALKVKTELAQSEITPLKSVSRKMKTIGKPAALNTVQLLKYATKHFGMSSHSVMGIAEKLYLQGYVTYPRTETTSYPKNFNFKNLVDALSGYPENRISSFAKDLLSKGKVGSNKGKDCGDHPPITPTSKIPSNLSGGDSIIYDYIASYYLSSVSSDLKYEEVKYETFVGSIKLTFTEKILIEGGFKEISKNPAWKNEYK